MTDIQSSRDFFSLTLAFAVVGISSTILPAALPEIKADFGIGNREVTILFLCWGLGIVGGSLMGSSLSRRIGERRLIAAAALAGCIALYAASKEPSLIRFQIWITIVAAVVGVIITIGHGIVGSMSRGTRMSTISFLDFAVSVGALSTPFLINALESGRMFAGSDWRDAWMVSFYLWLAFLAVLLFTPSEEPAARPDVVGTWPPKSHAAVVAEPSFLLFGIISFAVHSIEYGHSYWFTTYTESLAHIDHSEAREILAAFLIGMATSRLLISWIATDVMTPVILAVTSSVILCLIAYVPQYDDYASLYLVNLLLGLGVGCIFPASLGLSMLTFSREGALLSGAGLILGTLGGKATAMAIGYLIDTGNPSVIYSVLLGSSIVLLASILVFIRLFVRRRVT